MTGTALRAPGAWALLLVSLFFGGAVAARQLDGWVARVFAFDRVFDREAWRAEKIATQHELIEERLARRLAVARSLSRGELPLEEAAARFRDLDRLPPEANWGELRRLHPDATEEEFRCVAVIEFTKRYLAEEDPALSRAVAERLDRELQRLRTRAAHVMLRTGGEPVLE
jgi:hypothetical protein